MQTARLQILVAFFLTVSIVITYRVLATAFLDHELKQARIAYEAEKLQLDREQLKRKDLLAAERFELKRANLQRYDALNFYGVIGILCIAGLSVVIVAAGHSRAKVTRASVYIAKIGQHSEIPIHHKDLQSFYPIAVNLSLAEIEASASSAHEKAYRISRQMITDITEYTRVLAGKRGLVESTDANSLHIEQHTLPGMNATPTFEMLLHNGMLAPGKPLILGYDRQGQPQTRSLHDLKSLAIAGWQGSGKTLSMGYLVASSVLSYGAQVYIIDPHKQHPESLSGLIRPLEGTGHVTVINPFDTPALLEELNQILDCRLSGEIPSQQAILLVIDEMARLAKMECFDTLVTFLERCTEETRKANITFIGGSHKWTARHFKGRADIRACMNSMLIHKTKPSQADLLLEDAQDKHLVKHIQHPGEAILVTDYDVPNLVSIPFCRPQDMQVVAAMLNQNTAKAISSTGSSSPEPEYAPGAAQETQLEQKRVESTQQEPQSLETAKEALPHYSSEVIPFDRRRKSSLTLLHGRFDPKQITHEMLQEQLQLRKQEDDSLTQAEIARRVGVSQSYLSRLLHGKIPLKDIYRQKLYDILFEQHHTSNQKHPTSSRALWGKKKIALR